MPNYIANVVVIKAEPNRKKEVLEKIQDDTLGIGSIDFNKLCPMPESLNIECGSTTDECIKLYLTSINPHIDYFGKSKVSRKEYIRIRNLFNKGSCILTPYDGTLSSEHINSMIDNLLKYSSEEFKSVDDIFIRAKTAIKNIEQYGFKDWYEWSVYNWGTKWNASHFHGFKKGNTTLIFHTAWAAPHPILELLTKEFPDVEFHHAWADEDIGANVGIQTYKANKIINSNIPKDRSVEAYEMASDILVYNLEDFGLSDEWQAKL